MTARTRLRSAGGKSKKVAGSVARKPVPKATQHLQWRGKRITLFESRVYELISTIPAGKVSTYGDVAKALQSGPRCVGQALRKNPFAPEVPCHRVVAASLDIGGFQGSIGDESPSICKKRTMLSKEGVVFTPDNKIHADCLYEFSQDK